MRSRRLLPLLALLLAGCEPEGLAQACTMEFRIATLVVSEGAGAPVGDATVQTRRLSTGEILTPTTLAQFAAGTYPILDDGATDRLNPAGDSLGVTVARAADTLRLTYVFDVPGGCHIRKLSGPDSVTLP